MKTVRVGVVVAAGLVAVGVSAAPASPPPYPFLMVAAPGAEPVEWGAAESFSSSAWSPDGARIALAAPYDGLFVIGLDDGSRTTVTEETAFDPSWSPDGGHLAFVHAPFQESEDVYIAAVDGGDVVPLTTSPGHDLAPSWSPDGESIAYYYLPPEVGQTPELRVASADGSFLQVVSSGDLATARAPEWDASGNRLFFAKRTDGAFDVYRVDADGTDEVRLTTRPGDELGPRLSPDGSTIAFSATDGIFVMDAEGGDPRMLRPGGHRPSWSPDGTRIAFDDGDDIMTIRRDGLDEQVAASYAWQSLSQPEWSPAGNEIAYLARFLDSRYPCDSAERDAVKPTGNGFLVTGTDGEDVLHGSADHDYVCGYAGGDAIDGGGGPDQVFAGPGPDVVRGGRGNDLLEGDRRWRPEGEARGDDVVIGGPGKDILRGGSGDDVLRGGPGRDRMNAGEGRDRCHAGPRDRVRDCEEIV
jgi:TolB protein